MRMASDTKTHVPCERLSVLRLAGGGGGGGSCGVTRRGQSGASGTLASANCALVLAFVWHPRAGKLDETSRRWADTLRDEAGRDSQSSRIPHWEVGAATMSPQEWGRRATRVVLCSMYAYVHIRFNCCV